MNLTLPLFASLLLTAALQVWASDYKYIRVGSDHDVTTKALPGYALMGGGEDLDEAFRFLCEKGTGGDFLILRAAGDDEYNPYVNSLCKMNSVATLIIPSRQAANDPRVADVIEHAEAIFIAGGDQARYINWWQHTPVEDALNAHIAVGKSLGGTSAGLAVMGEYIYSAHGDAPDDPDLTSAQALADPYFSRVTVRRDFLKIDLLRNTLTDSHFAKRNRMGRSLVFLARIVQDAWFANPREIAVDEKSAVLVEKRWRRPSDRPWQRSLFHADPRRAVDMPHGYSSKLAGYCGLSRPSQFALQPENLERRRWSLLLTFSRGRCGAQHTTQRIRLLKFALRCMLAPHRPERNLGGRGGVFP